MALKKRKRNILRILLKYVLIILVSVTLLVALLFTFVYHGAFGALPDAKALKGIQNEEASLVMSSDNKIIGKFFAQNRTNITSKQIPEHLKNALIATEDKRFFSHKGYDNQSYFRVLVKSILMKDNSSGGGSTLTQQLVKNLYGRTYTGFFSLPVNKVKEILIAARLEKVYSKEALLMLYLNSVPFGEDVYGVESAAHRYFSKPARALKIEESAVLIGMLKANTYFNPQINPENSRIRRNVVISLMKNEHYLSVKDADSLQKLPLKLNYENQNLRNPAGYFVYQVKKKALELLDSINRKTGKQVNLETDGLKIYTSLNLHVQQVATLAVKNHLMVMQKLLDKELERGRYKKTWYKKQLQLSKNGQNDLVKRDIRLFEWDGMEMEHISRLDSLWHYYKLLNASVLITNPKTGEVITWVGGNDFSTLPFDMVLSHRQIASAFKPILYATALESGTSPCTYLENEVNKYPGFEDWEPQNDNHISTPDSTVALWYALTHSMNLPTLDLYFRTGRDRLVATCKKLRFPNFPDAAPSNALGTLDLSLYEIVKAYGAFANGGRMNDLVMIQKITNAKGKVLYDRKTRTGEDVFSQKTSQQITAILESVINQGTGARIRSTYGITAALAGKTGTAQNYSNAWFLAYTPDMVIGTWVGASRPDVHFFSSNGSGSALALPVVATIIRTMEKEPVLRKRYLTAFQNPEDMYAFLQCDPYHRKISRGFFKKLFHKQENTEPAPQDTLTNEKKKHAKKSFFERLFHGG